MYMGNELGTTFHKGKCPYFYGMGEMKVHIFLLDRGVTFWYFDVFLL